MAVIINNWLQIILAGITIVVTASFLVRKISQVTSHDKVLFAQDGTLNVRTKKECHEEHFRDREILCLKINNLEQKFDQMIELMRQDKGRRKIDKYYNETTNS